MCCEQDMNVYPRLHGFLFMSLGSGGFSESFAGGLGARTSSFDNFQARARAHTHTHTLNLKPKQETLDPNTKP